MITFLSSPKPFTGSTKENQYRAIRSWQAAANGAEVILYGDSDGIDEAGNVLGVSVQKQIRSAPSGIPYFGAIVGHAMEHGKYDIQVYINCDILISGILMAMRRIEFPLFLLFGQLIDLGKGLYIDFNQNDWQAALRRLAEEGKVTLRGPESIDYFGFRRGTWRDIPPVVIGRGGYDSALLAYCLGHQIPLIDATFVVTALHQFHDYVHVQGGKQTVWHGKDAQNNLLHAGRHSVALISDANYVLRSSVVQPGAFRGDWLRRLELAIRYRLGWPTAGLAVRIVWRILHLIGVPHVVRPKLPDVMEAQYSAGIDVQK